MTFEEVSRKIKETKQKRKDTAKKLRAFADRLIVRNQPITDIEKLTVDTMKDTIIALDSLIKKLEAKAGATKEGRRIRIVRYL